MEEATVRIKNGDRYCNNCGEFLGKVCDPFGNLECSNQCFTYEYPNLAC